MMSRVKKYDTFFFFLLVLLLLQISSKAEETAALEVGQSYIIQEKEPITNIKYHKKFITVKRQGKTKICISARKPGDTWIRFKVGEKEKSCSITITKKMQFKKQQVKKVFTVAAEYKKVRWTPVPKAHGYYVYKIQNKKKVLIKRVKGGTQTSYMYKKGRYNTVYSVKAYRRVNGKLVFSKSNPVFIQQL